MAGGCGWVLRRGGRLVQTGGAAGVCVSKVNSSARQPVMTPATVCESVCLERFYTKASLPLPTVFLTLLCGKQRNKLAFTSITNRRFWVALISIPLYMPTCIPWKWENWSGVSSEIKAQRLRMVQPSLSHFERYWDIFLYLCRWSTHIIQERIEEKKTSILYRWGHEQMNILTLYHLSLDQTVHIRTCWIIQYNPIWPHPWPSFHRLCLTCCRPVFFLPRSWPSLFMVKT